MELKHEIGDLAWIFYHAEPQQVLILDSKFITNSNLNSFPVYSILLDGRVHNNVGAYFLFRTEQACSLRRHSYFNFESKNVPFATKIWFGNKK